jgi:pyruvate dehydrogenase E1 component alpha subunit
MSGRHLGNTLLVLLDEAEQTPVNETTQVFSLINPDGSVHDRLPITVEEIQALYADMVEARVFDTKVIALQRQGRLATYAPFRGQEAAQIAAAAALRDDDWVAATYRDAAFNWRAGYPWELLILGLTGDERGGEAPEGVNILPPSITVGGHLIHAVGLAWAEKLLRTDRIALTSFSEGATSVGAFHEAMNLAAVYETPTVFFCQNNGCAVSYPTSEQTRSASIAVKAHAYGMPGVQVDGNDVVAVLVAVREAATLARSGKGPSLIEAVTYCMCPHTTADDPTRYRDDDEGNEWAERDPLTRIRILLESQGSWSEEWQADLEVQASRRVESAVGWAESVPEPTFEEMLTRMYAEPTTPLREQSKEGGRPPSDPPTVMTEGGPPPSDLPTERAERQQAGGSAGGSHG